MRNEDSSEDNRFDDRVRQCLVGLPAPSPPEGLFKHAERRLPWQRTGWISAAVVAFLLIALTWVYPPALVNSAWAHVAEERGLRGDWIHNPDKLQQSLDLKPGQPLPGLVQLRKECMVGGHRAYHVSTFVDGKGWVTILSFQEPVKGAHGQGEWLGRHWEFLPGDRQHPILLLSDSPDALRYVAQSLSGIAHIG